MTPLKSVLLQFGPLPGRAGFRQVYQSCTRVMVQQLQCGPQPISGGKLARDPGYAGNKQASMWPAPGRAGMVPASRPLVCRINGSTTYACGSSPASREARKAPGRFTSDPTALAHMDLGVLTYSLRGPGSYSRPVSGAVVFGPATRHGSRAVESLVGGMVKGIAGPVYPLEGPAPGGNTRRQLSKGS